MKTRNLLKALIFILGFTSCGQTPEEQKMIDAIMKKQDSMMNNPQMKEMMDNMKEREKMFNEEKKNSKVAEEKTETKTITKSNDDWYWENNMVSKNNRFENWTGGAADITIAYKGPGLTVFKIGMIKADGSVVFDLPEKFKTQISFERQMGPQGLVYDIFDGGTVKYTNKDVGFITNPRLLIMRNDEQIGKLSIGNSVRVPINLTNQSLLSSGDEGYLLYWAYADEDCSLKVNEDWQGDVRRDGTNTINVKTNVYYDLNFKKGWNLVKTEVIGNYPLDHERGLEMSWFKKHKHSIITSMPGDAKYYFKSNPY